MPAAPSPEDLRRAVSTAHHTLFHAIAITCADIIAGADRSNVPTWPGAAPTAASTTAAPARISPPAEPTFQPKHSTSSPSATERSSTESTPTTTPVNGGGKVSHVGGSIIDLRLSTLRRLKTAPAHRTAPKLTGLYELILNRRRSNPWPRLGRIIPAVWTPSTAGLTGQAIREGGGAHERHHAPDTCRGGSGSDRRGRCGRS